MIYKSRIGDDGFRYYERIPEYGDDPVDCYSDFDDSPGEVESDEERQLRENCASCRWALRRGGQWLSLDGEFVDITTEGCPILLFPFTLKWVAGAANVYSRDAAVVKIGVEEEPLRRDEFPLEMDRTWVKVLSPELGKCVRKFFSWDPLDFVFHYKKCFEISFESSSEGDGDNESHGEIPEWGFPCEMAWLAQILADKLGGVLRVAEIGMPSWYPEGGIL